MKATKRFLSAIMAMTMVCGTAVSVSADVTSLGENDGPTTGESTGTGAIEGYANKDVLCVVLPTTKLDFIVDPQGLIKDSMVTNGTTKSAANTKYKNATWNFADTDEEGAAERTDGFIFFAEPIMNEAGTAQTGTKYTNHLKLKVENKSSYAVTITPALNYVDGKVDKNDSDSATFGLKGQKDSTTFTDNSQYLVGFALDSTAAANLKGVSAAYEVKYGKTGYTYELNKDTYAQLDSPGNTLEVTLTGASNPKATTWAAVNKTINDNAKNAKKDNPTVKVTWTIAKATEG